MAMFPDAFLSTHIHVKVIQSMKNYVSANNDFVFKVSKILLLIQVLHVLIGNFPEDSIQVVAGVFHNGCSCSLPPLTEVVEVQTVVLKI